MGNKKLKTDYTHIFHTFSKHSCTVSSTLTKHDTLTKHILVHYDHQPQIHSKTENGWNDITRHALRYVATDQRGNSVRKKLLLNRFQFHFGDKYVHDAISHVTLTEY